MIQRVLDTSEHTRELVELGLTSTCLKWMNILLRTFALAIYVNVIKLSGIRSMGY